jgi:hypothetical protein
MYDDKPTAAAVFLGAHTDNACVSGNNMGRAFEYGGKNATPAGVRVESGAS